MYEKPDPPQWSVHAEVTISHSGNDGSPPSGQTHTEQNGNGLRMVYTWTTNPSTEPEPRPSGNQALFQRSDPSEAIRNPNTFSRGSFASETNQNQNIFHRPESETNRNLNQNIFQRPEQSDTSRNSNQNFLQRGEMGYQTDISRNQTIFQKPEKADACPNLNQSVFQRGGMVFTSVPPRQTNLYDPTRLGVPDSGYNSELLSPSSSQTPRRPIIPYNRRCRSTCSIILSTAINTDGQNLICVTSVAQPPSGYHQCGRTQSLRCQTPTIKPERRDSYYGCGDPWCYHAEDRRCSPVLESCEECSSVSSKRTSRANTFTTHFCTRVPERNRSSPPNLSADYKSKDMTTQTVETREKCTSPLEKIERKDSTTKKKTVRKLSDRRRSSNQSSRRNSDSNTLSPSMLPENADNRKSSKRVTRSPMVRGRSPLMEKRSPSKEPTKKQRTVHIDVYCTGSDCSESDSSTESEETHSSPQTVFESEKVKISHRRADTAELPYSLQNFLRDNNMVSERKAIKQIDSDEETAYPSALSSYSAIADFESSVSSVPQSWSAISSSTCTVPDEYDSIAATSCKDTVSDFESLIQKRFSLVPDESEYFIPRKLNTESRASMGNFSKSDSFEYDDSADRDRIKNMEQLWAGDQKTWKSPSAERKFMLQQQKMREYLEKRVKEKRQQKESETESAEDDSEQGWIVRPSGETNLKRDDTVRRAAEPKAEQLKIASDPNKHPNELKKFSVPVPEITTKETKDFNKVQPSSSCNSIIAQRLNPHLRKPFTVTPGIHTDQLERAQKFGTVIGAIRKPGHHIGPAKNPDCLCDHCRQFYANSTRSRTRSVGDNSEALNYNWRDILKPRPITNSTGNTVTSNF